MENQRVKLDLRKLIGKRILVQEEGLIEVIVKDVSPSGEHIKLAHVDCKCDGVGYWRKGATVILVEILEGAEEAIIYEEPQVEEIQATGIV